ncbi:MAG: DUF4258 domain-containing protein, partial [Candidatus Rokuibacteriota bacterium]
MHRIPSALVLGFARGRPVHVVVALNPSVPEGHIITVYEPSPDEFEPDGGRGGPDEARASPRAMCPVRR